MLVMNVKSVYTPVQAIDKCYGVLLQNRVLCKRSTSCARCPHPLCKRSTSLCKMSTSLCKRSTSLSWVSYLVIRLGYHNLTNTFRDLLRRVGERIRWRLRNREADVPRKRSTWREYLNCEVNRDRTAPRSSTSQLVF
jgi:hypothetical protein